MEAEWGRVRAAATAADERAKALESSLNAVKDQFVRLQADFDNFRRRTVRLMGRRSAVAWGAGEGRRCRNRGDRSGSVTVVPPRVGRQCLAS